MDKAIFISLERARAVAELYKHHVVGCTNVRVYKYFKRQEMLGYCVMVYLQGSDSSSAGTVTENMLDALFRVVKDNIYK